MAPPLSRTSLPEAASETLRNGALNGDETPSRLVDGEQFFLGAADDRCRVGASRMAALAHDAARENGFSLGTVGGMVGKDKVAASRAFDREDPATALRLIAALILLDKNHVFLSGLCRLAGGEFIGKPRLTKEQKYDLVVAALDRLGRPGRAILSDALGDETP